MTIRKTLYFTSPKQVEVREEILPAPSNDEVLVQSLCSAISAGTEMLVYRGDFPHEMETDSAITNLRGGFKYPLAYGYACVGKVSAIGNAVNTSWQDKLVFSFQPHTTHFIARPDTLFPIPENLSPETACFFANAETAVNLIQDAAPIFGERVMVFGQGVVGLLTTTLLKEFPLTEIVTADCYELRREMSKSIDVTESIDPETRSLYAQTKFDLTFELSGRPATLNDCLAVTAFGGRIIIGSWYGEKRAMIDLGGDFHRSRIKMISSQVSTIAPELSGRWSKSRRFEVTWKALERIQPAKWITHRFSLTQAVDAYRLLDEYPQEAIQAIFVYPS